MKVLRSYRISTEMDLAVATEVSRRLNAHERGSQAEVVEEYFMLGMAGGAAPGVGAGLDAETQEAIKDLAAWWECDEADVISRAVGRVHAATKAGREAQRQPAETVGESPVGAADVPGVQVGVRPSPRESGYARVVRERAEKEARIRARSSIGNDPSFVADPEYAQE